MFCWNYWILLDHSWHPRALVGSFPASGWCHVLFEILHSFLFVQKKMCGSMVVCMFFLSFVETICATALSLCEAVSYFARLHLVPLDGCIGLMMSDGIFLGL